jgi:hypothetical protein
MLTRTILATVAACALAVGIQAQEQATIVLRSGEKVSGQLVDMGGAGFAVRVNGQERTIAKNEVAVIDFAGSGEMSDADWAKVNGEGILLRNGQAINGQLYDIGGTSPLRVTVRTSSGEQNVNSSEISRIVLARPGGGATATSGDANTAGVPDGQGIAVPANQAWTATGITVRQGEVLTFNTTGEVRLSNDPADIAGSAGSKSQRKAPAAAPIPGALAGALVGRIGSRGEIIAIGDQTRVTMPAAGQLFLGINDDHVADNSGGFRVNVQRAGRRR